MSAVGITGNGEMDNERADGQDGRWVMGKGRLVAGNG